MERIREIIRLHESEFSQRKISQALNVSRPVVAQYLKAFCSKNLKYADIVNMPDDELLELLSNKKTAFSKLRYQKMATFFPDFGVRLKQKGQTLHNLWKEYIAQHPDGYSYSQFCYYYRIWRETNIMSMHIDYKAGDKMLVDFTGQKLKIVDPITNRPRSVEVFVAILGAS